MNWLRRLFGLEPVTPPHVREGLEAAAAANDATGKAMAAVDSYWKAARVIGRSRSDAIIDEYQAADEARTRAR